MTIKTPFNRGVRGNWLSLVGLTLLACAPAACTGNSQGDDSSAPAPGVSVDTLPNAQVVDVEAATGIPTLVTGDLGAAAKGHALAAIAAVFRADASELSLKSEFTDPQGEVHSRYTQFKNGLEVLDGELVVHSRGRVVYAANGSARADIAGPAKSTISSASAVAAALRTYAGREGLAAEPRTELAYKRSDAGDSLLLVHKVTVTGTQDDGTPIADLVLVNAADGSIVDVVPSIHTARNREVHNLNGGTSLPGPVARTETGAASSDAVVNNNFARLGSTYDTYKALFNRDSINGSGSKLISSVHYSSRYNNAFWNGTQMVYGDGDGNTFSNLANSLDVTAHELTHGVTSNTSNLTYSGQSGGLNESLSDIFGQVVEWYAAGKVVSAGTWQVGEDVYTPNKAGDALRYLNDPKKDGRSLDYYPDFTSGVDVHYSSGISNLAFYLLSQGGTHPRGKTTTQVTGIGIEKAAQIFYRANTSLFTASTTFSQAKTWTAQAAQQLGYSTAEVNSVRAAWTAVGVP
ncbi:M4 family metallopeptidase [Pendulispora rubella]|uniref:Neutral metalloproteinase n=1 Tax=Pendulispora rubella TaxID=2741070 RepID=A0ABZ2L709_9BACT